MKVRLTLKKMLLTMVGALCALGSMAQSVAVTGVVRDADDNQPLPGVSVAVAGTSRGTVTNFDGQFSLSVNAGEELIFSFIGYATQQLPASSSMDVALVSDMQDLLDVVVIGYGRAKKDDLTGSVAAIKPDELSKGITNNASDMLVGKIAGVDVQTSGGSPGAGATIRIRGGASLSASNDPLYVIDGLVIDNNTATGMSNILAMINPSDIETFTVLKDASATAIYGSRASNGVIIVTTKKGRAGQKPTITYNGDATVSMLAKKYEVLSGDEYRDLMTQIDAAEGTSLAAGLGTADTDWQEEIFRTTVSNTHNISITGGLKNMPYRIGVGYNTSNGIMETSWMRRFNASINLAPTFLDQHLNVNFTAKYMYEKNRYADSGAVGSAVSMDPTREVYDDSDNAWVVGGYYQNLISTSSFNSSTWTYTTNSNATQNPLAQLETDECRAEANDVSGNIEVDYKIHGLEDLHIHGSFGAQYTDTHQTDEVSPFSYSNNYYGWSGDTYYWKYNMVGNAYLQYMHEFGNHNLDIMAGAEQSHYHRSGYNFGSGSNYETGEEYNPSVRSETEWGTHNSLVSYFARMNYSLLGRYMLTATFRADGSSRFADGNRWGYFPSVAVAWKVNQESFLRDVEWLDELKVRAGWGKTGQQDGIDDFYYTPLYVSGDTYGQYPFGDTYYYTTRPNKYNPDLTWEKTQTINAGIDFSAYNGRFTANADYYYRKTEDLLSTVSIPAGMNFGDELMKNVGDLENYGVELALGVKPVVTQDFTWDISYNIGWNHNEITALDAGANDWVWCSNTISRGNNTKIQRNKVGESVNSFFVYQQVYGDDGKPIEGLYVDRNGDGQITDEDRYYFKSPSPDVIMGLTMKFLYKHFDLSMAFRASIGNYVYYDFLADKATVCAGGLYTNSAYRNTTAEAVELGFTGTTTNVNYLSDYFVRNASYLKCTNITLGYSFDPLFGSGDHKYCGGRVFATVQNPFIVTKYDGIDPEITSGIDSSPYPRPISVQIGLNLNF